MKEFFEQHVKNGGSIPTTAKGLMPYLKDVYISSKTSLKEYFRDKRVILFYDETYDSLGRFVSCILISATPDGTPLLKPYLAETFFDREPLNHGKVAQHVMATLANFSIPFSNVVGYCTDNAAYMIKSYNDALKALLPNCQHLTCISHILNLVSKCFIAEFKTTVEWSMKINSFFAKSGVYFLP